MSFIQPATSVAALAKSAILRGVTGLRLRNAGSKSFFSLRSQLPDPKNILTDIAPLADDLQPIANEAASSAMKDRFLADPPLYRLQNPFTERAPTAMAAVFPLPDPTREPSALNPRAIPSEGPNQKASTSDGKQITKQSKSPPERQSLRRTQSQPSGKSIQQRRLRLRREKSLAQS